MRAMALFPLFPSYLPLKKSGAGASVPSAPQGLSLLNYSNPLRVFTRASDGENFFFFGRKDFVNLFHKAVVDFLSLCLGVFLDILGHALFDGLFEAFDSIAAGVTYTYLGLLDFAFALLDKLFTALFGQRRDADAYHLAIVFGHDAEVAVDYCTFDFLEDRKSDV